MRKERELWNFIAERLNRGEDVMLLIVAESTGSSPGRAGYKMAVGTDGSLVGSIGGGVMEVELVERSKDLLSSQTGGPISQVSEQTHRKNAKHPSGMICSGEQTVILKWLGPPCLSAVLRAADSGARLVVTAEEFVIEPSQEQPSTDLPTYFQMGSEADFLYREKLEPANTLYIIGGGHCALGLSELMSRMDFRIHIFDDRPNLNTLQKNDFADEITILESYDTIGEVIREDENAYVAVMTLGYKTDALVIRQLADRNFKYFGVLGSKAKMATLLKELRSEGIHPDWLARVRTPIGIPINSHTPEEIAVSIAAEIILVKNT